MTSKVEVAILAAGATFLVSVKAGETQVTSTPESITPASGQVQTQPDQLDRPATDVKNKAKD